jgi:hypothetical protein
MSKKPQGGPHTKERKILLAEHGRKFQLYRLGRLSEFDLRTDVLALEEKGITFPEITAARAKALRGTKGEGSRVLAK